MRVLKRLINFFFSCGRLYRKDKRRRFSLPLGVQVSCWRRGFLPESYVIYNLRSNDHNLYLSDYKRIAKGPDIYKGNSLLLDSKLIFHKYFKHTRRLVEPLLYCARSSVVDLSTGQSLTEVEVEAYLKHDPFVVKPSGGGGGYGILFVSFSDGWMINSKRIDRRELMSILFSLDDALIFPAITQTGFARNVNPNSLNTIRFVTMVDPVTNEAFCPISVFRCGSDRSGKVDNWSNGGYSALIDVDSGIVGKAVSFPQDGRLEWLSVHPDSKMRLEGIVIPHWETIKKELLQIAKAQFFLPYIGWDIVPMEDGFIILEGNSNSDVNLLQVHRPLLVDERVKRFFEFYGVI